MRELTIDERTEKAATDVARVALEAIRDAYAQDKTLRLLDVRFLLDLVVNGGLSAAEDRERVRAVVWQVVADVLCTNTSTCEAKLATAVIAHAVAARVADQLAVNGGLSAAEIFDNVETLVKGDSSASERFLPPKKTS